MEKIFSIASSSSSVTYGNISCSVREFILSKFPYEFFKYTNISSEIAYRNLYRQFGGNNNRNEIKKRRKPYLVIRPTYQVNDPDAFLNNIPLTKNYDNLEAGIDKRHLFPILKDPEKEFNLKYKLNRDRIEFDVTITLATLHQQLDLYKFMVNQMVWERSFIHRTSLEAMIPRSMIDYIGKLTDLDITNENQNMLPILLQYLNNRSNYPITYKMKNASGRDEFFMYYNHDTVMTLYDLAIDDGSMKNMISDSFNITFRVSIEFNLPGLFLLEGDTSIQNKVQFDLAVYEPYSGITEFIPIYTIENIHNKYPSYLDGFRLYTSSIFNVETGAGKIKDTLDISPLFENATINVIRENSKLNVPMDTFAKVIILKDNIEMVSGADFIVDWNNLNIDIFKLEKQSTYRLIIYINNLKLNESLVENTDDHSFDKPQI